jgi:uridine nucleosidase
MRDALLAQPRDTAWLVAIGPLTNIANLFSEYPEVGDWIKGLSIMGGAIMNGYTDAWLGKVGDKGEMVDFPSEEAEFNIWVSKACCAVLRTGPEAA